MAAKWEFHMRIYLHARALIGVALFLASVFAAAHSLAAPNDYRFELVQAQLAGPGKTAVTVRLVHVPDNKPVVGAVLFESKTDMGPGGMAEMTGKVSPLPSDQPGIYRFQIETGMAGKWALISASRCRAKPGRCVATSSMRRSDDAAPTVPVTAGAVRHLGACVAGNPASGGTGLCRGAGLFAGTRRHT
jgi:YtkA-like